MQDLELPTKLRGIRQQFGWSQDELADALSIAKSTLVRWENTQRPLAERAISRHHPNRALSYLLAMVDEDILSNIRESDGLGGLFYGEDYRLVALTSGMVRRYPLTRAVVGFSSLPFVRGRAAQFVTENIDKIRQIPSVPGSGAVWRIPKDFSMIVQDGWTISFNAIGNQLVLADVEVMKEGEEHLHEEAPGEFFSLPELRPAV
ncbi:helix-turn-helix domain-containing protein [Pseudooceanicola sp. MF1-13]|uniref:helix-turn-helix domain-containing protein n=1 Tax=Pseudooceanicola sp. MF1-13 TaxID=3379095 RepID=UPI003891F166